MSEVDGIMYVVLSKAEKHVPYGELFGTTEMRNVIVKVSYKPRLL
jgi:hypothetical protein